LRQVPYQGLEDVHHPNVAYLLSTKIASASEVVKPIRKRTNDVERDGTRDCANGRGGDAG
jgi:hypothetical protein